MGTPLVWHPEVPPGPWQPGWCFPSALPIRLSRHYVEHVAQLRPPIDVVVPGRDGHACRFCIDSHPTDEPDAGWEVSAPWPFTPGERPAITVHPSINLHGIWHGFLADGVLGPDLG